ncbi:MAG: hypothetical protein HY010_18460 [Acidobacteria bacterium]|nr:hypothetical protein [Acidobacteriota bacterium]
MTSASGAVVTTDGVSDFRLASHALLKEVQRDAAAPGTEHNFLPGWFCGSRLLSRCPRVRVGARTALIRKAAFR